MPAILYSINNIIMRVSIGLSKNKRKRTIIMPTLLTSFVQDFIYTLTYNPYAYTHGLWYCGTKYKCNKVTNFTVRVCFEKLNYVQIVGNYTGKHKVCDVV